MYLQKKHVYKVFNCDEAIKLQMNAKLHGKHGIP